MTASVLELLEDDDIGVILGRHVCRLRRSLSRSAGSCLLNYSSVAGYAAPHDRANTATRCCLTRPAGAARTAAAPRARTCGCSDGFFEDPDLAELLVALLHEPLARARAQLPELI